MDWTAIPRRLRQIHYPWDVDKSNYFADTMVEADTHRRALEVIRADEFEPDSPESDLEWLERLGVQTETLIRLRQVADDRHGNLDASEAVEALIAAAVRDNHSRGRTHVCKLRAAELFAEEFLISNSDVARVRRAFARFGRSVADAHATGILAKLPDVSPDVALLNFMWLLFGAEVTHPERCTYPHVSADMRWTDAFVRYVEPDAKKVAAYRMGLPQNPEFRRALEVLDKNNVHYTLTEVDTTIGDVGLDWTVKGERRIGDGAIAFSAGKCDQNDEPWCERVAKCRRLIETAQVREGLDGTSLYDQLKDRFPERGLWTSLTDALNDGFVPFPVSCKCDSDRAQYLLADLGNEWFGQLSIQLEVMKWFDRFAEPIIPVENVEPAAVLRRIEKSLHSSLCNILERRFGRERWWVEGVPVAIRKNCAQMREEDGCGFPVETYMYILGLQEIVTRNWRDLGTTFEGVLKVQGKKACERWFDRLNRVRNLACHPLRGDLPEEDHDFLRGCDQEVSSITARLERLPISDQCTDD